MSFRVPGFLGRLFVCLTFVTVIFSSAIAQQIPGLDTAQGASPMAAYKVGDIDNVNPLTGNLFLNIPLLSYPQRGKSLKLQFRVYYNDKQWFIMNWPNTWVSSWGGAPPPPPRWAWVASLAQPSNPNNLGVYVSRDQHLDFGRDDSHSGITESEGSGSYNMVTDLYSLFVREANGAKHYYGDVQMKSCSQVGTGTCPIYVTSASQFYASNDGTGFSVPSGSQTNLTVLGPDGVTYAVNETTGYETISDPQGNSITQTSSGWTDTIGRQIPGTYAGVGTPTGVINADYSWLNSSEPIPGVPSGTASSCPSGTTSSRTWAVPSFGGGTEDYYLCYSSVAFQTAFALDTAFNTTSFSRISEASGTATMLTAIVLPNAQSYTFTYDQYLSLTKLTLPTGGTISYTWQNVIPVTDGVSYQARPLTRSLKTRTVTPGNGQPSRTWRYYWKVTGGTVTTAPTAWWSVETDPFGNDVERQLSQSGPVNMLEYSGCSPNDNASDRVCNANSPTLLRREDYVLTATAGSGASSPIAIDAVETQAQVTTTTTTIPSSSGNLVSSVVDTLTPAYASCTELNLPTSDGSSTTNSSNIPNCYRYNQVASEATYDFGSGSAGSLLKTVNTTYQYQVASQYVTANLLALPATVNVLPGSSSSPITTAQYNYDGSGSPSGTFGNLTSVVKGIGSAQTTASTVYNTQGMPTQVTDGRSNTTTLTYDSTGLFLSKVQKPTTGSIQHTDGYSFDSNTGNIVSHTDENSRMTNYSYADPKSGTIDPLNRLRKITYPATSDGNSGSSAPGYREYNYTDTVGSLAVQESDLLSSSSNTIKSQTTSFDGMGEVIKTSLDTDPISPVLVVTGYDALGHISSVTNPYRSGDTIASTSYTYDALNRMVTQGEPDNSTKSWSYLANAVTETDETSNQTKRTSDALGRLTQVLEPSPSSQLPTLETDYAYDALNNLTSVNQVGMSGETPRKRGFTYDSLSRLLISSSPETGTICYGTWSGGSVGSGTCQNGYDANGNLLAKTDARAVTMSYQYDALNRMIAKFGTGINYSYTYDQATQGTFTSTNPIGRLVWASNGVNADIHYSYDAMGRVVSQTGCTPDNCSSLANPVSAQYDLAGNMTSLTYPDGRVISQGFDGAAHLNSVSYASWNGAAQSVPYLSVASSNGYDAAGHLINATMGNGIGLAAAYNNREEISSLAYGTSSQLLWGRQLAWTANGNLQTRSDPLTNIQRQFGYDNLNRLTSAQDIFAASTVADTSPFAIGAGGVDGSSVTSDGATGVWTNPDDSNILINPDQPGASGWEVANANIANGVLAPDGTTTAATFTATSGSTDTFLGAIAAQGSLMDGETMTGSVWLRAPNGSQVIDLYLVEVGTPGNVVTASKQITVTTTWQQFQLSGKFQYGYGDLIFQIGGGGTVKSGQAISLWESKLEDAGTSGIDVTNFLPYSQQLNPQTWGLQAATYSNNSGTAPDGSNTAITVTASSGSTDTWLIDAVQNPAPFGGTSITGSVWLRSPSGSQNISLTLVTTNAGTLGQTTVALTSTWQRFQVSGTTPTTLTELQLQIGGAGTFTNGQSVQIWGAQVELANVAGPYVPTDGVPATIGANLTNLLPYSQEPNAPSWILTNTTGVPDAVAAPDSSTTGFQMTVSSGVTDAWATDNVTNPALYDGATVTESLFARIPGSTALTVDLYIVADTASGRTYIGPTSMQLNGNWQRFTVHGKLPNGLTSLFLQIGGSGTFSSGQTIDIWGAQLELASNAGPYVMTTAQPVIEGKELTNILPNSQMLSGPSWGVSYGSAVNNAAVAPDGTTTASIVTGTASSPDTYAIHSVPNPSLYDGETVTASVYLRVASGTLNTDLFLVNVGDANWSDTAQVPIALTTTWQRFSITGTNQNGLSQLSLQIGGGGSVTSGASFQVWGAQMVVGSSAAPYIIATSSTTNTATGQATSVAPNGLNQSFTYDSFGNLQQNGSFTSTYTAQNQMFGYAYDAAGNLLSNGIINMSWDAEGKLASAGGANYVYTPEGDRVSKLGVGETDTIYFGGRPIARFSAGAWTDLIYGPNGLLAEVPGTQAATPNYRLLDHLGTQVGTVGNNGLLVNPMDYTPFGQAFSGATSDPYVYTGKERDAESGLDYFGARYYASGMGRWMSPDPIKITEDRLLNPANTLNLYSYGANNPLKYIDPDGQDVTYFYDQGGVAGHAVLFAYNPTNGQSAIESFGPSVHSPVWAGESQFEMSSLTSADNLRSKFSSLTIQTSPELAQQVIDYIKANPDPSTWTAIGPNCSTQVWKILQKFKLANQHKLDDPGLRPKLLWNALKQQYNPQAPATPKSGTDYGSPRCGGNSCMFDLMWQSLPQSQTHEKVTVTIKTTDGQVIQ